MILNLFQIFQVSLNNFGVILLLSYCSLLIRFACRTCYGAFMKEVAATL